MQTETTIWVTTDFVGFHCWKEAPDEVDYLRERHRHVFNVRLEVGVSHPDRDVEFHLLKAELDELINETFGPELENMSCEQMAADIYNAFRDLKYNVKAATVAEDLENGATVAAQSPLDSHKTAGLSGVCTEPIAIVHHEPGSCLRTKILQPSKPFLGVEAEGPFKGMATLFIPGTASVEMIRATWLTLEKYSGLINLYYGAADDHIIKPHVLKLLGELQKSHKVEHVIVEYGERVDPEDFWQGNNWYNIQVTRKCVKTIYSMGAYRTAVHFKVNGLKQITDEDVYWLDIDSTTLYSTPLTDFRYQLDTHDF